MMSVQVHVVRPPLLPSAGPCVEAFSAACGLGQGQPRRRPGQASFALLPMLGVRIYGEHPMPFFFFSEKGISFI